jgi:hypothetical protein
VHYIPAGGMVIRQIWKVYVKMFRVHPVVLVSNIYVNRSTVCTIVFIEVKR